jgi:subtilisin family serine protease
MAEPSTIRRAGGALITTILVMSLAHAAGADGTAARRSTLSADVSPAVVALLGAAGADEPVTVVVHLREHASLGPAQQGSRSQRQRAVVRALRETATRTQVKIRRFLDQRFATGTVSGYKPLWVTNAVVVTAIPAVISELAARAEVESITSDDADIVMTGTPSAPPEPGTTQIGVPPLWNLGYDGAGVVVASLDSGVDMSHPDLAANYHGGTSSWFDPYGQHPTPTDLTGHGTATMGVMVGGGNSGTTVGVAPGATWMSAKIFDDAGNATTSAIHQALQWVLDPDGDPATADAPVVLNNSWSYGTPGCNLEFQLDLQALRAAGILPVFAAGNYGSGASTSVSPANYPEALSVGAIDSRNRIWSGSSRGPSACGEPSTTYPDVVAPGVNIWSTDRSGLYSYWTGTSLSAPAVAGAIALLSSSTSATASATEAALLGTTADIGAAGPDNTFGHGRIDVSAAFAALGTPPTTTSTTTTSTTPSTTTEPPTTTTSSTTTEPPTTTTTAPTTTTTTTTAPTTTTTTTTTTVPTTTVPTTTTTTTTTEPPTTTTTTTTTTTEPPTTTTTVPTTTTTVPPPLSPNLYFSTLGDAAVPGVGGTPDDADIYSWNNSSFNRTLDATGVGSFGLPSAANIDGFDRVDATHFYVSFAANITTVPGLGSVEDEDVVYYSNGVWSVYFDGTARGLTASNLDLDAISILGGILYFSTTGNTNPPGVTGTADNADIYSWNGSSFARVWDATANGVPSSANVDGYVRVDATHFYLSFNGTSTTVSGLGAVADVSVVENSGGAWSVYFDGTAHGLVAGSSQDIDAFDIS